MPLERVTMQVHTNGYMRPSEIVADLRNVSKALFHPLRAVAYWDDQAEGRHVCPHQQQDRPCPHHLPLGHPDHVDLDRTVEEELKGRGGGGLSPLRRHHLPRAAPYPGRRPAAAAPAPVIGYEQMPARNIVIPAKCLPRTRSGAGIQ